MPMRKQSTLNHFYCPTNALNYTNLEVIPTKHTTKYLRITTSNFSQAQLCTP